MKPLILVIEDENNIRQDIVKILNLSQFDTIDTDDGNEAVKIAKEKLPNLIISDIMMPKLDGYSVFKQLQENHETSTIPFLFLSAKSSKEDIRMGMNIGIDDYVTKPFDIKDLVSAVQSRLNKQERTMKTLNKRYEDLKQSLYRTIPHEIRTPLNTILGYSEYLKQNLNNLSTEKSMQMLEDLHSDAIRLQKMFENFIFLSKIEYFNTNMEELRKLRSKKTLNSEMLIKDIYFYFAHDNKRIYDLIFELEDADLVIFDEHFVKIIELIADNSFKFSKFDKKIIVKTYKVDNNLVLSFKDFGIGISEKNIKEVAAFKQFNRELTEQQGNGLGLEIVKSLLKLYYGSFEIDSHENEYTNVIIRLPLFHSDKLK